MSARVLLALALATSATAADLARIRDEQRAIAREVLAAYVFVGGGSGVVVSPDGLVLTNHHVVDGDTDQDGGIDVRFASGAVHHARVLGSDPVGDIALLALDLDEPVACAELAPAEALVPGMPVIAVGNPFGLGDADNVPSLSTGVLSTARIVRDDYTDALQIDAPVNPGNSGGPLFDLRGRVLGINGQIRTVSGMRINSGVGLAVCSTQLAAFMPVLQASGGGYAHHTAAPKELVLAADDDGVRVAVAVDPLAVDDRVLAIAGRAVASVDCATGLFESLPWREDATIPVRVRRDGVVLELMVASARKAIPGRPYHGLSVAVDGASVIVDHVDDDSPAQAAGIAVGDVVASVGERAITRRIDWLKATARLEIGDHLRLHLARGDEQRDVDLLLRLHP